MTIDAKATFYVKGDHVKALYSIDRIVQREVCFTHAVKRAMAGQEIEATITEEDTVCHDCLGVESIKP